jgi:hypothetical protein
MATGAEESQLGGAHKDMAAYMPCFPTPIEQEVLPRPCPWPKYCMPVPTIDGTHAEEVPIGHSGSHPAITTVPVVAGMEDGAGNVGDGINAVENRCCYPKWSNHTNPHFTYGVDG